MNALVVEDAREYVFPVFSVRAQDNGVLLESRTFLGTGFFVTKRGDAITANHVIPTPDELEEGRRLIAIVQMDGEAKVCWITRAAKFELLTLLCFTSTYRGRNTFLSQHGKWRGEQISK